MQKIYCGSSWKSIVTSDVIALLFAVAWPKSVTPINIMSGFKKCGVYPLNPGEITDRQITPSSVFCSEKGFNEYDVSSQNQSNNEQE